MRAVFPACRRPCPTVLPHFIFNCAEQAATTTPLRPSLPGIETITWTICSSFHASAGHPCCPECGCQNPSPKLALRASPSCSPREGIPARAPARSRALKEHSLILMMHVLLDDDLEHFAGDRRTCCGVGRKSYRRWLRLARSCCGS